MRNTTFVFLCALTLMSTGHANANNVGITLTKEAPQRWFVSYRTEHPVAQLSFVRNPNKSRTRRWTPLRTAFTVLRNNGVEYIARKDGEPFSEVTLALTPTYTPLAKEYAPFSPFSDGGMLLHSARFFACAERCSTGKYGWQMTLNVPQNENVIVDGQVSQGHAKWRDARNGQKVYVGNATPVKDAHFVSVIDSKLPQKLHLSITNSLPKLMTFFSDKFGRLSYRPALFASYSKSKNGRYGNQGGTLPGQVFMHWYGSKSIQPFDSEATYWFFAHEVAHLYQGKASLIDTPGEAWIHEGAAELLAGIASEPVYFEQQLDRAKQQCQTGLKKATSYSQAAGKNPTLHYSCGLLIFDAIQTDLQSTSSMTIFTLWQLFNNKVRAGAPASSQTLVTLLSPYISSVLHHTLSKFSQTNSLDVTTLIALSERQQVSP